jgi:hypothetical protein
MDGGVIVRALGLTVAENPLYAPFVGGEGVVGGGGGGGGEDSGVVEEWTWGVWDERSGREVVFANFYHYQGWLRFNLEAQRV